MSLTLACCFLLSGCVAPGAGKTFAPEVTVEFEGLRFSLASTALDSHQDHQTLSCHLTFQSLHDKPLEPLFFPRFTLVDSRGREFEPMSSMTSAGSSLNPGMSRDASVQFELPGDALEAAGSAARLRVMCPMVARAGFMMQEAQLQGYFFYFNLAPVRQGAGTPAAVSSTIGDSPSPTSDAEVMAEPHAVRNGMSRQQVFDLWGKPINQTDSGSLSIWGYNRDGAIITLQFTSDRLTHFTPPFSAPPGMRAGTDPAAVLRNGMSWKDVYAFWGRPASMVYTGETSAWGYQRDGGIVSLQFESGVLVNYSPPFVPGRR